MTSMGLGKFKCAKCKKPNYAGKGCKSKKCEWCGAALRLKRKLVKSLVTGVEKEEWFSEEIKGGFKRVRG